MSLPALHVKLLEPNFKLLPNRIVLILPKWGACLQSRPMRIPKTQDVSQFQVLTQ
jgi:hypothetical protein